MIMLTNMTNTPAGITNMPTAIVSTLTRTMTVSTLIACVLSIHALRKYD